MALQPFNGYTIIGPVSVADIALFGALGLIALSQLLSVDGWVAAGFRPLGVLFGGLTIWLTVAGSGRSTTQLLAFALLLLTLAIAIRDTTDLETVLWGALAGSVIISLLTIYSIFIDPSFGGRVSGSRGIGPLPTLPRTVGVPIGSFGSFATYALAPLGYALVRWVRTRERWLAASSAIIIGMVIVHQTRATYLALIALIAVVFLGRFGHRVWIEAWRRAGASALALVVMALTAVGVGWVLLQVNVSNALSRFAQYDRAVELITAYPMTGITPPVLPYFTASGNIPHNVILLVGVVGGLPAIVLLLSTFVVAGAGIWHGYTSSDPLTRDLSLGIAAGWAATLTSLSLAPGFTRAFWMLVGLGGILLGINAGRSRSIALSQKAVESSRLGRLIRWATAPLPTVDNAGYAETWRRSQIAWRYSIAVRLLTNLSGTLGLAHDATETRVKIEAAWERSTILIASHRVREIIRRSRLSDLLIE
jgi:hypothetical protein